MDRHMDMPIVRAAFGGELAVVCRRKPGREGPNEDSAAILTCGEAGVLVIADGAGGMPGGDLASALAVESIFAEVREAAAAQREPREAILRGFERANQGIRELGGGSATTLAAVEICGRRLRTYHAGDSAIVVMGQRGKLKLVTVAHSPVGYAVEAGLLDQEEALRHEDLHMVSNLVGMEDMRVEMGGFTLSRRDTVVVASDGLFDNLRLGEIVDTVRSGDLSEAATTLLWSAVARMESESDVDPGKPDDLSFVLYRPLV